MQASDIIAKLTKTDTHINFSISVLKKELESLKESTKYIVDSYHSFKPKKDFGKKMPTLYELTLLLS